MTSIAPCVKGFPGRQILQDLGCVHVPQLCCMALFEITLHSLGGGLNPDILSI